MAWLARNVDARIDPRAALPGARSAIAVALFHEPASRASAAPSTGEVARYAGGDDYHDVMGDRLRALGAALEGLAGRAVRWRAWVDTGPVLERAVAARAGLGWIG
jgi:epoxyqueuosine reductase